MSLPTSFDDDTEYFKKIMETLQKYKYLYNYPNTDILVDNILECIQIDSLNISDIFDNSLEEFRGKCHWLDCVLSDFDIFKVKCDVPNKATIDSCSSANTKTTNTSNTNIEIPLSNKKRAEIVALSNLVAETCDIKDCQIVVDIGCGLGYLSQHLNEKYNLKVLGIDMNEKFINGAKIRQQKYHKQTIDKVFYWQHKIDDNSYSDISQKVEEIFNEYELNFFLVGLHACADLTVTSIDLFSKMKNAQYLFIMPCCYHKMSVTYTSTNKEIFGRFPISEKFKTVLENFDYSSFLRVPFMRLACQPSCVKDDLSMVTFRLLSRAVLQYYAKINHKRIVRKKRKAVKKRENSTNFEDYLKEAIESGYKLESKDNCSSNVIFDRCQILEIWRQFEGNRKKVAMLILLQRYLQEIFENLILYDRLVYSKELGLKNCRFVKVLSGNVSSRCLALYCGK